jgi:hypothetical protein
LHGDPAGFDGKPTPGFDGCVVDDDGKVFAPGEEGHVAVRVSPERPVGLFREYWRDPEATDLANSPTLTIQGRIRQVHAFFRERTPEQLLATAAPHSSPWLPDGYMQNHEQAASALVAPAELPVVDLHAGIQPGLHVGRAGQHGLHSGAVT